MKIVVQYRAVHRAHVPRNSGSKKYTPTETRTKSGNILCDHLYARRSTMRENFHKSESFRCARYRYTRIAVDRLARSLSIIFIPRRACHICNARIISQEEIMRKYRRQRGSPESNLIRRRVLSQQHAAEQCLGI